MTEVEPTDPNKPEDWRAVKALVSRALRRRNVLLAFLGVIFLLSSQLLAGYIDHRNRVTPVAEIEIQHAQEGANPLFNSHTWISLLNELGFAFIIALVISLGIEESSREELNDHISRRVREIQRAVFRATYGNNLPQILTDEVERLVLRSPFVRKEYRCECELQRVSARDIDPNRADIPLLELTSRVSYIVTNVSEQNQTFEVGASLEKPFYTFLHDRVAVTSLAIDNQEIDAQSLKVHDDNHPDSPSFKVFGYPMKLEPSQRVVVSLTTRTYKFVDDTEVWRSVFPSEDMTLVVKYPECVHQVYASALHRTPITRRAGDLGTRRCEWSIPMAVLPQQGIVFWWSSTPEPVSAGRMVDEGAAAVAQGAAAVAQGAAAVAQGAAAVAGGAAAVADGRPTVTQDGESA